MTLLAGGLSVLAASFLGGVTGFGYSLVVTVNLSLACVTRMSVAYRFRADLKARRAAGLIAGSVPGLWLGVAPELLLARDKAAPRSVLADLALYFVASNAIGLAILLAEGALATDALCCGCRRRWPATGPAPPSARACPKPTSGGSRSQSSSWPAR